MSDVYDTYKIDLDNLPSKSDTASLLSDISEGQGAAFGECAKLLREWTMGINQAWFGVALTPFRALGYIRDISRQKGLEPELMPALAAYWKRMIDR